MPMARQNLVEPLNGKLLPTADSMQAACLQVCVTQSPPQRLPEGEHLAGGLEADGAG